MDKNKFVFNDFLILEEYCNSNCKYCAGFYPRGLEYKRSNDGNFIMPEWWKTKIKTNDVLMDSLGLNPNVNDFYDLAKITLNKIDSIYDYLMLKLSGGEIFMYPDLTRFLSEIYSKYNAIQLLTNATLLSERKIDEIKDFSNVYFQISLDGVDKYTNRARTDNQFLTERILENIDYIQKNNIGLEINCVLTKYNIDGFFDMVRHFSKYKNLVIVPRPVRGEPRSILEPGHGQINALSKELNQVKDFAQFLPPREYFDRMIGIMEDGKRKHDCHVPQYVMASNVYGDIDICTRSKELGNVGNIFDRNFKSGEPKKKYFCDINCAHHECEYCIIQYELINLLLEGQISIKEVSHIPTFKIAGIADRIDAIKKELS